MLRHASVLVLIGGFAAAQTEHRFEVATVKPPASEKPGYTIRGGPGNRGGAVDPSQIEYVNFSLRQLLLAAYDVLPFELAAPSWTENTKFDVKAKLPPGTTAEQVPMMLQSLLLERFHVVAHREPREQTLYTLTVAKGGPKLKETTAPAELLLAADGTSKLDKNGFPPPVAGRVMRYSTGGNLRLSAGAQDGGGIAKMLGRFLEAKVVDRTGLTGKYDFNLEFAEDNPPPESLRNPKEPAAALPTALQEQLGLRLDKTKGPVDVLVIDRIDRAPAEN